MQVLARDNDLLLEFESNLHIYSGQVLEDWILRIFFIRNKGYGLSVLAEPYEVEIDALENITEYMKQLRKLRGN